MVSASLFEHSRFHPCRPRPRGQSVRQGRHLQAHCRKRLHQTFQSRDEATVKGLASDRFEFRPIARANSWVARMGLSKKRRRKCGSRRHAKLHAVVSL